MGDYSDQPFKAEYAKSGRASCKMCKSAIAKDSLRLAIMVQSHMFDGKVPNWHHFSCFWKRAKASGSTDIHGFDSLRWEDQEKVTERLTGGGGGASGGGDAGALAADYKEYLVEYAKSNQSTCRGCKEKIAKGDVRLSKKDYEGEGSKMYGPQDLWHHVDCFVENREELEFNTDMQPEKIKGFKQLKKEDQDEVIAKMGKGSAKAAKKRKQEEAGAAGGKKAKIEESEEEKKLREQNKLLWKIRDELAKNVSNNALKALLEYNSQDVPGGESKLLDRVSDCMAFGALKACAECGGQLVYSGTGEGYRCTGNLTEWTKCIFLTKKPTRKNFKVPEEFHDVDFLKKYKCVKKERLLPKVVASTSTGPVSSSVKGPQSFEGMKFVIVGKTTKTKEELKKAITDGGGKVVTKVDKTVTACISSEESVKKNLKQIKESKEADVHVIDEGFLESAKDGGAALFITQHSLCSWGSDPHGRIDVVDGPSKHPASKSMSSKREETMFTKSVPLKRKLKVKGGAAVDPESELEDTAHVLMDKDQPYDAVLGLVDIVQGTNSYYKLQALQADKSSRCWLFRSWGRVGTTIGGNKLETCGSKDSAIRKFKELYGEKTGNSWEDRKSFVKYPKKFYPLEIDYGGDDEEIKKFDMSAGSRSTLSKPVQDLVRMIFDVESMKKAMLEFEIDLKKMPLGKLSKNQIQQAFKVLTELTELMDSASSSSAILDASNRFYTLIPHDFGMKKPPMLDTTEIIKAKTDMLNNLLDIEVAYSMLKSGEDEAKDPLDVHYEKLKTDIKEVDHKDEEYQRLVEYLKNTHASTHQHYDLEVEEIYKIERDGENKRFKPFKSLGNRKLLWHGSGVTNFAGILSQGLRIAPPEAPVTGYMFGKGIYFANMVSKSANYCRTTKSNPVGLLLLCEVALGNMHELTGAQYIASLPKGKHSTKGIGMTEPDPTGTYVAPDGVEIPMGKGKESTTGRSSLLYDEFIVYDTAQVKMKYLLKTNFKFNW